MKTMKMISRRSFLKAAMAAATVSALGLTGCGSSASSTASSTAASSASSEASSEEADEMAAKNVADLIDAIYVQERNENTDAQCEAAKAAWDALTDAQKEMVEGEEADPDYFGRDTGDASKDDARNEDNIGDNEILDDSNFQHPAVSPFSVQFHLLLFIETYFGAKCNGEVRNRFLPICKNPPECCFRLSASIKLQRLEQLVRTLLYRFIITFRKHIPAEVRVPKQQNRPGFRNRKPGRFLLHPKIKRRLLNQLEVFGK